MFRDDSTSPNSSKTFDSKSITADSSFSSQKRETSGKYHCLVCKKKFGVWKELFDHLTNEDIGINVFGCFKCSLGFLSLSALLEHERQLHPLSRYVDGNESLIDIAAHIIVCLECGVHVAIIGNPFGSVKANYELFSRHASPKFIKISMYSWTTTVREYVGKSGAPKAVTFRLKYVPLLENVKLECEKCHLEMESAAHIEEHAIEYHSDDVSMKSCVICSKKFATEFEYQAHTRHTHMSEQWFLLDFLSSHPNLSLPLKPRGLKPMDRLTCDLCKKSLNLCEFNKHDCTSNYTRRLQFNGAIVKSPSIILRECCVDLAKRSPILLTSIVANYSKMALITLKFNALALPTLEDIRDKAYATCRCCESIFDKSVSFSVHLTTAHHLYLPASVKSVSKEKFGEPVRVDDFGVWCTIGGCSTRYCSVAGLEWHLKTRHFGDFLSANELSGGLKVIDEESEANTSTDPPKVKRKKKEKSKKESQVISLKSERNVASSSSASSSKARASKLTVPTVLLYPPPMADMIPAIYKFFVEVENDPETSTTIKKGKFVSCEPKGKTYFLVGDEERIKTLEENSRDGTVQFAINCIPSNYKLPKDSKLSYLSVLPVVQAATAEVQPVDQATPTEWECPVCSMKSTDESVLRTHLKECHSFFCVKCNGCFVTGLRLEQHDKQCKTTQPERHATFLCTICSEKFARLQEYYSHLIDVHQNGVDFDETTGQVHPSCQTVVKAQKRSYRSAEPLSTKNIESPTRRIVASIVAAVQQDSGKLIEKVEQDLSRSTTADKSKICELAIEQVEEEARSNKRRLFDDISEEKTIEKKTKIVEEDSVRPNSTGCGGDSETSSSCGDGATPTPTISKDLVECEDIKIEKFVMTNPTTSQTASTGVASADQNDDDIEIISSDDDEETGESSTNRCTLPCSLCSRKFRTAKAVEEHMKSHVYDAGSTLDISLPVPFKKEVFICRLCCLAYENAKTFENHAKKHGAVLMCGKCTSVSLAYDILQAHMAAHDNGKLVFGCALCRCAYRNEKNLLLHMSNMHGLTLMWTCQKCCKANTDWSEMVRHVAVEHKQLINNIKTLVLPSAHCKLHYQPENAADYQKSAAVANIPVGECPHRTFLAYSETLVGCPRCGSMILATRYLLENDHLRKEGQFKLFLVDEQNEKNEELLHPVFTHVPIRPKQQAVASTSSQVTPNSQTACPPKLDRNDIVRQILNKGPAVQIAPTSLTTVATQPNVPIPPPQPLVPLAKVPTPISLATPSSNVSSTRCTHCSFSCESQAQLKVHLLRHDQGNSLLFCLECGFPSRASTVFYAHMLDNHGAGWMSTKVDCTCQDCGVKMTDLEAYKKHQHIGLHICNVCSFPTSSNEDYWNHTARHAKYGNFFCPFCSAFFSSHRAMEIHRIRHACDYWVMCRECGWCCKAMYKFEEHFNENHVQKSVDSSASDKCLLCSETLKDTPLYHFLTKHSTFSVRMKITPVEIKAPAEQAKSEDVNYFDRTKFREVLICQTCLDRFDNNDARAHALAKHPQGSPDFWLVLTLKACSFVARCTYCSFTGQFDDVLVQHLKETHNQTGRYLCRSCDEEFDSRFDRNYHLSFNHGGADNIVHHVSKFSPLNCVLCGICVADAQLMKHLSSHHFSPTPLGHVTLDVCSVCGLCFVNKSEDALTIHMSKHKDELAEKRLFFKMRVVDGMASGMEPPICDICDDILSWNAANVVHHFIDKHARGCSDAMWKCHRAHQQLETDLLAKGKHCRMCTFINLTQKN